MKRILSLFVALAASTSVAQAQIQMLPIGTNNSTPMSVTNPLNAQIDVSGAAVSATAPLPAQLSQGNSAASASNPIPVELSNGSGFISATSPQASQLSQGNAVLSATNGIYANVLTGNAVTSSSNPIFTQLSADGTNAVAVGHPEFVELSNGTASISGLTPNATNALPVSNGNSTIATYSATTAFQTPVATPTDIVGLVGSSTKTVKIQRIVLHNSQTTAGLNKIFLIKRSAADTGSTIVNPTVVPLDSSNAAATAVVNQYTSSNPTTGTAVGTVSTIYALAPAPGATSIGGDVVLFDSKLNSQPITLRGATQELDVNFAGAAVPTGWTVSVDVVWTEE